MKELLDILVVEDNKEYQKNAKSTEIDLHAEGFNLNITVVDNVVDALREIETKKYGMLVSDINIFAGENLPKIDFSDKFEGFNFNKAHEKVYGLLEKYTKEVIDPSNLKNDNKSKIKKFLKSEYGSVNNKKGSVVSEKSMKYVCKRFNQEREGIDNSSRVEIETIPVVLKAKQMDIPYGIVTRVHNLSNLGNYLAVGLISEEEVAIGNLPTILYFAAGCTTNEEIPNNVYKKILDINKNLESRVVGVQEQGDKTSKVWAQAIKNVMDYYNMN